MELLKSYPIKSSYQFFNADEFISKGEIGTLLTYEDRVEIIFGTKNISINLDEIQSVEINSWLVTIKTKNQKNYSVDFAESQDANEFSELYKILDKDELLKYKTSQLQVEKFHELVNSYTPNTYATYSIAIICTVVYIFLATTSSSYFDFNTKELLKYGANFAPSTLNGDYWRLFTSMFLHGSLMHYALNMQALIVLGMQVEKIYGTKFFIVLYILSGLLGSIVSIFFNPTVVSVGASGAIFGLATAFAVFYLLPSLKMPREVSKNLMTSTAIFIGYNLFYGLTSKNIDNGAHLGGALGGIIFGFILARPIDDNFKFQEIKKLISRGLLGTLIVIVVSLGLEKSTEYHRESYKTSLASYYYEKGFAAYESDDYETAIKNYILAAENGNKFAQYSLGWIYINKKIDVTSAVKWLEKSAAADYKPSISLLGEVYYYNENGLRDYKKALDYFTRSNEEKSSQFYLGNIYLFALGVKKNPEEAVKWLTKASENGIKRSDGLLGACYFDGIGVPQSYEKAVQYFRSAAKDNNDFAQYELSQMYSKGLGVKKDVTKSLLWLNLASLSGNKDYLDMFNLAKKDLNIKIVDDAIAVGKECLSKNFEGCE